MKASGSLAIVLTLCIVAAVGGFWIAPLVSRGEDSTPARAMDELLNKVYMPQSPGAAVIVTRDGQPIFRKGCGMADLELRVPIEPDMVFRLGSVTKQFTAVAVLMLEEQGKLALTDTITKFLPDYPTAGHTITVEHLLTHTSGIKSYTSMPEWPALWRKDLSLTELVDFFKNQPMDFPPEERWSYSNSGYILLGAIIEKASGQSYEEFIQKNIFDRLGMTHSCYDHTEKIIPRRVKGYGRGPYGFENAPFISMTQPYAAGALASSVDDLVLWDQALWNNKLVKPETLAKAHRPHLLKDGRSTNYGFGWALGSYEGHRTVEHGGGIHGFATYLLSMPDDHLFVAVLTNFPGPLVTPERIALSLAGIALGKPVQEPKAISLKPEQLDRFVGVYSIVGQEERIITRRGNQLFSQSSGGERNAIYPLSETQFFFPNSSNRLVFNLDSAGQVVSAELQARYGPAEIASRTEKPLPGARKEIKLDSGILSRYVGSYQLAPGFILTITLEGDHLVSQATGQPKVEVFSESETKFFLKVVDAQIEFQKDEAGTVTGLKLYQGGQTLPAPKLKP